VLTLDKLLAIYRNLNILKTVFRVKGYACLKSKEKKIPKTTYPY